MPLCMVVKFPHIAYRSFYKITLLESLGHGLGAHLGATTQPTVTSLTT